MRRLRLQLDQRVRRPALQRVGQARVCSSGGEPPTTDAADVASYSGTPAELEAEIRELLAEKVAPAVQADGGDVHYERFDHDSGVLTISLSGACVDCPSSTITMRFMINNCVRYSDATPPSPATSRVRALIRAGPLQVRHYIPEVSKVVRLGSEAEDMDLGFTASPQAVVPIQSTCPCVERKLKLRRRGKSKEGAAASYLPNTFSRI